MSLIRSSTSVASIAFYAVAPDMHHGLALTDPPSAQLGCTRAGLSGERWEGGGCQTCWSTARIKSWVHPWKNRSYLCWAKDLMMEVFQQRSNDCSENWSPFTHSLLPLVLVWLFNFTANNFMLDGHILWVIMSESATFTSLTTVAWFVLSRSAWLGKIPDLFFFEQTSRKQFKVCLSLSCTLSQVQLLARKAPMTNVKPAVSPGLSSSRQKIDWCDTVWLSSD